MLAEMSGHWLLQIVINASIFMIATGSILFLFSKKIRKSATWKATITPLASIIGSGFLVVTPLYTLILGKYAVIAVLIMVCIAYLMGSVIRYNIFHVETIIHTRSKLHLSIKGMEHLSYLSLSIAYLISISFYIKLLSLFLLRGINTKDEFISNCIVTVILSIIGMVGFFRGFKRLESLAEYAVNIKLSIILAMIGALIFYNIHLYYTHQWYLTVGNPVFDMKTMRELLGTIIIIQGFETSRYLSLNYSTDMRAKTMRYAQIISGIIYVIFVGLSLVAFDTIHTISETSIIDVSAKLSVILPFMLIIAAIMSQFSAAVADTVGAGGLLSEASGGNLKPKHNYLIICIIAIILTWETNTFQIITLASRAFAFYYAIQALEAIMITHHKYKGVSSILQLSIFTTIFIIMVCVALFGVSV